MHIMHTELYPKIHDGSIFCNFFFKIIDMHMYSINTHTKDKPFWKIGIRPAGKEESIYLISTCIYMHNSCKQWY